MKLVLQNGFPSPWPEGYEHPAILADVPYEEHPRTAYCGFILVED